MTPSNDHILVIRLGALGDLVFCFQAFYEIRCAHPQAKIALLTRAPFVDFVRAMPWFDQVIVENHPSILRLGNWIKLQQKITHFAPKKIYDLQGKNRQTILYVLLGGPFGPLWSGAAPLCRFPRPWPPTADMGFTDFLAAQLRVAGVPACPPPDLSWFDAPIKKFNLPERYVVLIPGCSPSAPYKLWSPHGYAAIANQLHAQRLICLAVGTDGDAKSITTIKTLSNNVIDLCGQTTLFELAGILRRAVGVIGNDTGPLHIAAAVGAPTLALFSGRSNPIWSKPPGGNVVIIQSKDLHDLSVDTVARAFNTLLQHTKNAGG